jgi:hypothetical protein
MRISEKIKIGNLLNEKFFLLTAINGRCIANNIPSEVEGF